MGRGIVIVCSSERYQRVRLAATHHKEDNTMSQHDNNEHIPAKSSAPHGESLPDRASHLGDDLSHTIGEHLHHGADETDRGGESIPDMASHAGADLRHNIDNALHHVEDAIGHGLHNLTHHGEQAADQAQQTAHDVGQQAQQAAHDTTQRAQDAIDSAKD